MLTLRALLVAVVALPAAPLSAQCTISGSVGVSSIAFREDLVLYGVDLPSVEVAWPPPSTGRTPARLRSPFDAAVELDGVPYYLRPAAPLPNTFFDAPSELPAVVGVEHVDGEDVLRIDRVGLHGVEVRCDDVVFGPVAELDRTHDGGDAWFLIRDGLEIFAGPRPWAPSLRVTPGDHVAFHIVERRDGWVSLEMHFRGGIVLRGWAPADPSREASTYGLGAYGFHGRGTSIARLPREGCYEGPAFFGSGVRVYAHERDVGAWGTVTDGDALRVRDCGLGSRAEIVGALGRTASFGWVDRRDLHAWPVVD